MKISLILTLVMLVLLGGCSNSEYAIDNCNKLGSGYYIEPVLMEDGTTRFTCLRTNQ